MLCYSMIEHDPSILSPNLYNVDYHSVQTLWNIKLFDRKKDERRKVEICKKGHIN